MFGVLTPRVDVTSPYNIHTLSSKQGMRILQYQMIATNLQENL